VEDDNEEEDEDEEEPPPLDEAALHMIVTAIMSERVSARRHQLE
jgi:hypothetical protein